MKKVTFTYDPDADAVYIRLERKPLSYTEEVDDQRHVDFAADGTAIGIELLYVSDGIEARGLPRADLVKRVVETVKCLKRAGTTSSTRVTVAA
ncbi:MAG: DUF2283 domain-containing protein [Dehalococcoidia bacterium]